MERPGGRVRRQATVTQRPGRDVGPSGRTRERR